MGGSKAGRPTVRNSAHFVTSTDSTIAVVHNFEFGGSDVTLSWVCAAEVANLDAMATRSTWTTFLRGDLTAGLVNPVMRAIAVRATALPQNSGLWTAVRHGA